jgi:hypothetical protein
VGKTRLAVEYAHRHAEEYSALLFVVADSPEALRRNLACPCVPLWLSCQPSPPSMVRSLQYQLRRVMRSG